MSRGSRANNTPRRAAPVQNSPCSPALGACPVQNSPCSPEMAQYGAIYACRESFVPFSPPRTQAGRTLYRTPGRNGASHNSTPRTTGTKGTRGTTGPRRGRVVGRASTGWQGYRQPNSAHNFPRSFFETTRKRCNSNDANSIFEQATGELRAKLLRLRQDHPNHISHAIPPQHEPTQAQKPRNIND